MNEVAIMAQGLGKRYRRDGKLGSGRRQNYRRLSEDFGKWASYLPRLLGRKTPSTEPMNEFAARSGRRQGSASEFWALKDVDFSIRRGEVVGIIGRNGAGKSTLLKVLSRIVEPTTGEATIDGRVASLLEVGTGFHPELTGRENIFLNGSILGMSRAEVQAKFADIAAFAEVEDFLELPVKRYSSGMYVRLAFAVAAHLDPDILIVDEVLAVGDLAFQQKCIGKMKSVSASGDRAVLVVSHNMSSVLSLCTRCLLLEHGRVAMDDSPARTVDRYIAGGDATEEGEDVDAARIPGSRLGAIIQSALCVAEDATFAYGHKLQFRIVVKGHQSLKNLSLGATIFRGSGEGVGTLFTRRTFDIEQGQVRTLELQVDNTSLAPGSYYLGLSVGCGNQMGIRQDEDVIVGVPSFRIAPVEGDSVLVANWHPNWGGVHFANESLTIT